MRFARSSIIQAATLALAFTAAAGDEPRRPGRVAAAVGSATLGAADERFVLFGWLAPPLEFSQPERLAELAAAGLDLVLPSYDSTGRLEGRREDNLAKLDAAAAVGVRCIVWDDRFPAFQRWGVETPLGRARLDSIVADYRDHPGFLAYYLGDEPSPPWRWLPALHHELLERDPAHPAWNNLIGRVGFPDRATWLAYTRSYLDSVKPAVLCNDHYDFTAAGDRGQFVENAAGLAALAREYGLPFWSIVQLMEHHGYRALDPGELRWQVSHLLAYGARGIGYFTYWTPRPDPVHNWNPAVIDHRGDRTHWYERLAAFDRGVRVAGETLAGLAWIATEHAGSTPVGGTPFAADDWIAEVEGRAALGHFVDRDGTPYVLVANSDSLAARRVTLALRGAGGAARLGEAPGSWTPLPVDAADGGRRIVLDLESGGFALLRLEGTFDRLLAGRLGPLAAARPNPARGTVWLALSRLAADARLEIVDATGRRFWARTLPAGSAEVVWRGERSGGAAAPPGLYFARVEDRRGVVVVRISWLGE